MLVIPREISILESVFDPLLVQKEYQETHLKNRTDFGATASFIGTMRDFNEGDDVSLMELEHYPQMTDKQLNLMIDKAAEQWPISNALVVHRVGKILPGEPIMMVVVWSAHRAAAFDACRFIMEELKHRAPFWKKEQLVSGSSRWVEKNTDGI
jgi:molybdopterin synthase catalytic subunit